MKLKDCIKGIKTVLKAIGEFVKKHFLLVIFAVLVCGIILVPQKEQGVKITGHMAPETAEGQRKISIIAKMLETRNALVYAIAEIAVLTERQEKSIFSGHPQDYWEKKALENGLAQVYKDVNKKWGKIIRYQSKQYSVDYKQVIAIICKESAGNQDTFNLESKTGAWGLMQVLLSTAKVYQSGITSEDLLDPELNIHIGVQHFATLKKSLKRDSDAVLAYHWGETGGRRLLANNNKLAEESDDWQFIQAIIRVAEQS